MNNFLPLSVIFSLAIVSAEAASMERGDAKWTFNPYSYAQQIIHTQTRNGVLKQCFILAKKVLPKDKRTAEAEKLIESIYNEHRQAAIEASRQEKIAQQQKKDDAARQRSDVAQMLYDQITAERINFQGLGGVSRKGLSAQFQSISRDSTAPLIRESAFTYHGNLSPLDESSPFYFSALRELCIFFDVPQPVSDDPLSQCFWVVQAHAKKETELSQRILTDLLIALGNASCALKKNIDGLIYYHLLLQLNPSEKHQRNLAKIVEKKSFHINSDLKHFNPEESSETYRKLMAAAQSTFQQELSTHQQSPKPRTQPAGLYQVASQTAAKPRRAH